MSGKRLKVYASRQPSTDELNLSTFEGERLTPTLNRAEAFRLACDIIELFQFPAAPAAAPAPPDQDGLPRDRTWLMAVADGVLGTIAERTGRSFDHGATLPDGECALCSAVADDIGQLLKGTIASPAPAQAEGWQPIATAPKDGQFRLVCANGVVCKALRWIVNGEDRGWFQDGVWCDAIKPSHWMPLPVPPSAPDADPTPAPPRKGFQPAPAQAEGWQQIRDYVDELDAIVKNAQASTPIVGDEQQHAGRWTMAEIIAEELRKLLPPSASDAEPE